jgi:hypothetical protein
MKLQDALKTSLDETRMQMLGVQVLFGFQFQSLFQDAFDTLSQSTRIVAASGMALMIATLALLFSAPCRHRITEAGNVNARIYRVSRTYAQASLYPFTAGIGFDVYAAIREPFGAGVAVAVAASACAAALCLWQLAGVAIKHAWHTRPDKITLEQTETPMHAKIEDMLTEARVILPGTQALLGFQLLVTLTKAFAQLPPAARIVHLAGLANLLVAVMLLIAPAAIHRIAFGGADDPRFHAVGSRMITAALLPFALALSCDVWLAFLRLFGSERLSVVGAALTLAGLLFLWYVVPFALKIRAPAS